MAGAALLAPDGRRLSSWPGRTLVLADASLPAGTVRAALAARGFDDVVDESNQPVELSDFHELVVLPLSDCLERLIPEDPRLDPFLLGLARYFRVVDGGTEWSVHYVKASDPAAVERALESVDAPWRVLGARSSPVPFLWILPLAAAVFAVGFAGPFRPGRLVFVLPWLPLWFAPSVQTVIASVFAFHAVATLDEARAPYGRGQRFSFRGLPLPLLVQSAICALLAAAFAPEALPALSLAGAGAAAAWVVAAHLDRLYESRRYAHRPFDAEPIAPRARDFGTSLATSRALPFVAASCLIFAIYASIAGARPARAEGNSSDPAPTPLGYERLPRNPAGLVAAFSGGPDERLPDVTDFLVHRAYQQALSKGRFGNISYGSLDPVIRPSYDLGSFPPTMVPETILEFDETWLREGLRAAARSGVIGFGVDGGRFFRRGPGSATGNAGREGDPGYVRSRLDASRVLVYIILLGAAILPSVLERRHGAGKSPKIARLRQDP